MKRRRIPSSALQKKLKEEQKNEKVTGNFLSGIRCHIHPANFGQGRLKIFQTQIIRNGGELIKDLPDSCNKLSHIVFEESVDEEKLRKLIDLSKFTKTIFVRCTWLSGCLKAKNKISTEDHEIISCADSFQLIPTVSENPFGATTHDTKGETTEVNNYGTKIKENVKLNAKDSILAENKQYFPIETNATPSSSSADKLLSEMLSDKSNMIQTHEIEVCKESVDSECLPSNSEQLVNCEKLGNATALVTKGDPVLQHKKEEVTNELMSKEESRYDHIHSDSTTSDFVIKPFPKRFQDKFACSRPSSSKVKDMNQHITAELEKLAAAYKSKNDTWRAVGYQRAIAAIRNHPREITSREEARSIPGVGERLADKVAEIVESGKLRKVAEVCEDEEARALQLFMGVWGAGPTTAQLWFMQGHRTLDDLAEKATLTRHQQIGLRYYEDLNSRIPREEAAEIEEYVRSAALSLQKGLMLTVCGSYRRGRKTCGDVDILVTHPDGISHEKIFRPLLNRLRETGFLTDDLVTQEDNGNQQKYLGVCLLPGENRKHRRLDIIVVPYAEYAPALMYFTGSAHFNRSMRLLAIKMGMSLSEHGLCAGVVRKGISKLNDGHLLDTPTEESIFKHLGLTYRPPHDRDH